MRTILTAALIALVLPVLASARGQGMSPVVSSKLTGGNEVPAKGDPNGVALAVVTLDAAKGTSCWKFKGVKGISTPNAAHIHKGGKGVAGPVVIPFGSAYKASGCVKAPKKTIEAIETKPTGYYVNIHNAAFPGGAVRGQLHVGMEG